MNKACEERLPVVEQEARPRTHVLQQTNQSLHQLAARLEQLQASLDLWTRTSDTVQPSDRRKAGERSNGLTLFLLGLLFFVAGTAAASLYQNMPVDIADLAAIVDELPWRTAAVVDSDSGHSTAFEPWKVEPAPQEPQAPQESEPEQPEAEAIDQAEQEPPQTTRAPTEEEPAHRPSTAVTGQANAGQGTKPVKPRPSIIHPMNRYLSI